MTSISQRSHPVQVSRQDIFPSHALPPATSPIVGESADTLPLSLHLASSRDQLERVTRSVRDLAEPPAYCPGCLQKAGIPFPASATTLHCSSCLDDIRRSRVRRNEVRG